MKKIKILQFLFIGIFIFIFNFCFAGYEAQFTIENWEEYDIGVLAEQKDWGYCGGETTDISVVAGSVFQGEKAIKGNNNHSNVDPHYKDYSPFYLTGEEEILNFWIIFQGLGATTSIPGWGEGLGSFTLNNEHICENNEAEGINLFFSAPSSSDFVNVYYYTPKIISPLRTYYYIDSFPIMEWTPISVYYDLDLQKILARIDWGDSLEFDMSGIMGTNTLNYLSIIASQNTSIWYADYFTTGAFDYSATGTQFMNCNSLNCSYCSEQESCEFVGCVWDYIYVTNPPTGICYSTPEDLNLYYTSTDAIAFYADNSDPKYSTPTAWYNKMASATQPTFNKIISWSEGFETNYTAASATEYASSYGSVIPIVRGYLSFIDNIIGFPISIYLFILIILSMVVILIKIFKP